MNSEKYPMEIYLRKHSKNLWWNLARDYTFERNHAFLWATSGNIGQNSGFLEGSLGGIPKKRRHLGKIPVGIWKNLLEKFNMQREIVKRKEILKKSLWRVSWINFNFYTFPYTWNYPLLIGIVGLQQMSAWFRRPTLILLIQIARFLWIRLEVRIFNITPKRFVLTVLHNMHCSKRSCSKEENTCSKVKSMDCTSE